MTAPATRPEPDRSIAYGLRPPRDEVLTAWRTAIASGEDVETVRLLIRFWISDATRGRATSTAEALGLVEWVEETTREIYEVLDLEPDPEPVNASAVERIAIREPERARPRPRPALRSGAGTWVGL